MKIKSKTLISNIFIAVFLAVSLSACSNPTVQNTPSQESEGIQANDSSETTSKTMPADSAGTASTNDTPTTSTESTPATSSSSEETNVIAANSVALFATISGGTKSELLKQEGGDISWDSTHYKLLRYVPAAHKVDEFGWTTSKSYAKSYIYGFTTGDWFYSVRRSSDTNGNDITRIDPENGTTHGQFPTITVTGDWGFSFTIFGDRLIYRTKIVEDLLGHRRGGGDVMAVEMGGKPVKLLDYSDPNNQGSYYAVGEHLLTIVKSYEDSQGKVKNYYIYEVDPVTLTIGTQLFAFRSEESITFYEGETALYWGQKDPETGDIKIIRFPPAEQPYYFLTISEHNPQLSAIDESQGKVLVVHSEDNPERTFLYSLVDLAKEEITELDVDQGFYSSLSHGNGQFFVLK